MQKMYIARDLKSIKKALERESDRWVAVVDNIDVEITQLNNNVIIKTSDLEDEMFSRSAEGKLIDINVPHEFKKMCYKLIYSKLSI